MPNVKLAYVLGPRGGVVGMAFVVSPCHLLTCAHVVATALDYDRFATAKPEFSVQLRFFEIGAVSATAKATVVDWRRCVKPDDPTATPIERENADIALLELDPDELEQLVSPKFAIRMRPVKFLDELRLGRVFSALGSPNDRVLGTAKIGGSMGSRWIVVRDSGAPIKEGFSGAAAVADEEEGTSCVLGMIARAHNIEDQALLIPTPILISVLASNGIASSPMSGAPARGPLLSSLRLAIDDLYVLKDRTETLDTIQGVLRDRTEISGSVPVFLIDCDPLADTLDGLVKRLSFEVARDFRLAAPLAILDFAVPDQVGDINQLARRHAREVAAVLQFGGDKEALTNAAVRYHGVHLRDVDLKSPRGIELAVRLVTDWATASSGRNKEVPFFVLLTTTESHDPPEKLKLAVALAECRKVELHELPRLGPVNCKQLRRWAREANVHLARPVRETAIVENNAQRLIYGEKQQMTMMDWFEGYAEHQSSLFRGA